MRETAHIVAVVASLLLAGHLVGASRASSSEVLFEADFDGDALGATARPGGPPTVEEEVYDDSNTTAGVSEVEAWGGGKRYRLGDEGTQGGIRGIRMPLAHPVSSGTVRVSVIVSAEQVDRGGTIFLDEPEEGKWLACVGFEDDGTFRVHESSTTIPYFPGNRYLVEFAVTLGSPASADYSITDLAAPSQTFTVSGLAVDEDAAAVALRYRTDGPSDGEFTVDDVVVTAE